MQSTSEREMPRPFNSGEYRIRRIEVVDGSGASSTLYRVEQVRNIAAPVILHFNEPFRLRVEYECTLPQVPDVSCGLAGALTLRETMEHAMYFNTNYPHSDEEIRNYDVADFRQYRGRTGILEANIHRLQVKAGDYLLTVGILPNIAAQHEFYEIQYMQYPITVRSNGPQFPAIFYANVRFNHRSLEQSPISGRMVRAGQEVAARHLPSGVTLSEEALAELYAAMRKAND